MHHGKREVRQRISMQCVQCSHPGRDRNPVVRERSQTQGALSVSCGVTGDENRCGKDTADSIKRIA